MKGWFPLRKCLPVVDDDDDDDDDTDDYDEEDYGYSSRLWFHQLRQMSYEEVNVLFNILEWKNNIVNMLVYSAPNWNDPICFRISPISPPC
jgi:hypothetical protein